MSSIQLCFLRKSSEQRRTTMTSFCMQFEKWGCGLLQEAFRSEGECFVSWQRGGKRNFFFKLHEKWPHVGSSLPDQFPQKTIVYYCFPCFFAFTLDSYGKRKNPEKWPDENPIYAPLFVLAPIYAPSPIYAPAPIYYSAPTVHTTESTTTVPQPPTTITNSNILSLIIIQDSLTAF